MQIDSYEGPDAQALLRSADERLARQRHQRRELTTDLFGASTFVVAATLLAVLAPWHRSLSITSTALVLVVWMAVGLVSFPVAGGWARPTMLVFVPALFVLPTPIVPVVAVVAILLGRAPNLVRGRIPPAAIPAIVTDALFTVGPSVVIVLAGAQKFAWSKWPIYLGALAVQVVLDASVTCAWSWRVEGIKPAVQLPLLVWLYAVDLALAPLGLVIAAVSVTRPGLVLLSLSPMAMLWLFARERQRRMDDTLALSTAYRGTAMLLGDVVEADHHYTGLHSRDVVDLSLGVAERLGLDATQRRNVEFAALLHDVGKIHIPKEIINKPGALNDAEWQLMRGHTIDGERMLRQVGGLLASVGGIVRATHEHYNGGGYPDGLAGDAIPIEARVVCACDAYSAMTTDRSYRKAMSKADALTELRRCAGTQFDPTVVDAIGRLVAASASSEHGWLDYLCSTGSEENAETPAKSGNLPSALTAANESVQDSQLALK